MAEGVDVLDGSRNRLSVSLVHSDKQLTRATECIINGLCVCVSFVGNYFNLSRTRSQTASRF